MKFHWPGVSYQDIYPQDRDDRQPAYVRNRRWKTVAAVILTLILFISLPVYAWFYYHRSMQSVAMVNMPVALKIGEGHMNDIAALDLSQIDVSDPTDTSKDVVFCVYGKDELSYNLQLAHTTNIGFTYTIFEATKAINGSISDSSGTTMYDKGDPLNGGYLNEKSDESGVAASNEDNNSQHGTTYGGYNNVQKNAEPLYWKTSAPINLPRETDNGYHVDYYILHIDWNGKNLENNKETDMVYLMAEAAS